MQPCTQALLFELKKSEWFLKVGKAAFFSPTVNILDKEFSALPFTTVSSWEEAMARYDSEIWGDVVLEASNRISDRVIACSWERYERWNDIASEMHEHVIPLVKEKTKDVMVKNNLPEFFAEMVRGEITHCCIESEYSDIVERSFFHVLVFWYLEGHYPCGWLGDFPEGKLVLF